jgi:four helix bundle protein
MQTELSERVLDYGLRTIKVVESLPKTLVARRIGDQLLRSATSVGANFEEAQAAESRDDFVHKLQVALKELRESNYWLRLLSKAAAPRGATRRVQPVGGHAIEGCGEGQREGEACRRSTVSGSFAFCFLLFDLPFAL